MQQMDNQFALNVKESVIFPKGIGDDGARYSSRFHHLQAAWYMLKFGYEILIIIRIKYI